MKQKEKRCNHYFDIVARIAGYKINDEVSIKPATLFYCKKCLKTVVKNV